MTLDECVKKIREAAGPLFGKVLTREFLEIQLRPVLDQLVKDLVEEDRHRFRVEVREGLDDTVVCVIRSQEEIVLDFVLDPEGLEGEKM